MARSQAERAAVSILTERLTTAGGTAARVPRPRAAHHTTRREATRGMSWRAWRAQLLISDAVAVGVALAAGVKFRPTAVWPVQSQVNEGLVAAALGFAWLATIAAMGGYQPWVDRGSVEVKRVALSSLRMFGVVAIASYALRLQLPRGFPAVAFPLGTLLLVVGRVLAQQRLARCRRRGAMVSRLLLVGSRARVEHVAAQLRRDPDAGLVPVGFCLTDDTGDVVSEGTTPVVGLAGEVPRCARMVDAGVVLVAGGEGVGPELLRDISWGLERSGVALVVSPALVDVASPRLRLGMVAGTPLVQIQHPRFTGFGRLVKRLVDLLAACCGLVLLSPLLLLVAIAVKVTSSGPVIFRQTRVGLDGKEFTVFKFRTMFEDAEARLAGLQAHNENDGLLFKIRDDPRVTPLGRLLRRSSVDELPQLLNVALGSMSLVGPRPLAVDAGDFQGSVRRRLLVRPGITGLWQVSGRSDCAWSDAVRLDLYYVENWSLALDLQILARTVPVLLRRSGAY